MEGQGHFTAFPQIGSVEKMKIPVLECWAGHAEAKRASHVADMAEDKGTFTVLFITYFTLIPPAKTWNQSSMLDIHISETLDIELYLVNCNLLQWKQRKWQFENYS